MKPYLHWCFADEAILYFERPENEVQRKYEGGLLSSVREKGLTLEIKL